MKLDVIITEKCWPLQEAFNSMTLKEDYQGIVMMGAPGAGKTSWLQYNKPAGFKMINPDDINKLKFGGGTSGLAKASVMAQDMLSRTIAKGENFILDGTAANPERIRTLFNAAKEAGYGLDLVYISVPKSISIQRNKERHAGGDPRYIPSPAVAEYWEKVNKAFKQIKNFGWEDVIVVDNE